MSPLVNRKRPNPRGAALLVMAGLLTASATLPGLSAQNPDSGAAGATRASSEKRVSLDFVGADVHTVSKALSIQSGVNVVLMPSVSGKVTIRQTNIPLEDALKRVAAAVGSDVRMFEDTYFLGSTVELRTMVARTGVRETVAIKYGQPTDAKELLSARFPYLTVETAGKSNFLILTGMKEDVEAGVQVVRGWDVEPPAVAKTPPPPPEMVKDAYNVKYAKAEVVAAALTKVMPELKVVTAERTLLLEGTKEQQMQAAKLLAALDQQGAVETTTRSYSVKYLHPIQASARIKELFPNVIVTAGFDTYSPTRPTFTPLTIDVGTAFNQSGLQGGSQSGGQGGGQGGSQGGSQGGGQGGSQVDLNGPGSRARNLILIGPRDQVEQATQILIANDVAPRQVLIEARMVDMSPETSRKLGLLYDWSPLNFAEKEKGGGSALGSIAGSFAGSFFRGPFNFSQTLEAMDERREAKILAKPNIAVVDGEEASIFIGDIFRYERLQSVTSGENQIFTIESVPIGVALLCRPRITEDGRIMLRVHPTVSTIRSFTGRNRDIPVTASREAESVIEMADGDTFAFGGLLREEELKIMTKIPLLGDLPVLGQLFRHRDNSKKKSEVTIFITAKLVKKTS